MVEWLNTLVQGLALAVVAWAVARPRLFDAAWRGRIWGAALVGLAGLTALTAMGGDVAAQAVERAGAAAGAVMDGGHRRPRSAGHGGPALLAVPGVAVPAGVLLAAWAAVALGRSIALALAIARIRAARAASSPLPGSRSVRLPEWTAANAGRFALVVSDRVPAPSMLGFGRPMIAVPAGWYERLSDEALDAVLMHELAHAERRDDLLDLGQQLLLAACWFHPAAWWIGLRLAFEREAACDERAARLTTTRRYARSLVAIAEAMQGATARPRILVASSGVRRRQLTRRIERLLAVDTRSALAYRSALAAPAVASIVALAAASPALPKVFEVADRVTQPPLVQERGVVTSQAAAVPAPVELHARRERVAVRARPAAVELLPARGAAAVVDSPLEATTTPPPASVEASLSSHELNAHVLPSADPPPAGGQQDDVAGRGPSAPFRALGSAFSRAGANTGRWFSRAGTSVASAVVPR